MKERIRNTKPPEEIIGNYPNIYPAMRPKLYHSKYPTASIFHKDNLRGWQHEPSAL